MLRILQVKEVLEFAAKMRSKKSYEEKALLVEEILQTLDIGLRKISFSYFKDMFDFPQLEMNQKEELVEDKEREST